MFSARVRVVVVLVLLGFSVLLVRALQVQGVQHEKWVKDAAKSAQRSDYLKTTRGRILDTKGRELAVDAPCLDVVVDYRAITNPPEPRWVKACARDRVRRRLGNQVTAMPAPQFRKLVNDEVQNVLDDIEQMWATLGNAKLTGHGRDEVEYQRSQVIQRVEMLRRYIWFERYSSAEERQQQQKLPVWKRWMVDEDASEPQLDNFDATVKAQEDSHVILPAVSAELANYLSRNLDQFPGLSIRPGQHRGYRYNETACQLLGYLGQVLKEDRESDPNQDDDRLAYLGGDEIGRTGIERMCESALRGKRGRIRQDLVTGKITESIAPEPGQDVRLTIDIELQRRIEQAFAHGRIKVNGKEEATEFHGAAVVLDVATNDVLALVSYPTYDNNDFDKLYGQLRGDKLNLPLLNRATQVAREPGSTVKPMVGIAGITEKVVGLNEGIECSGYLKLDGMTYTKWGRCWTMKQYGSGHHVLPYPHEGHDGNPDGWLTFSDALERSCNVYCETVAYRLGFDRLSYYYSMFGLGRPTGIGLPEVSGRLPDLSFLPLEDRKAQTCFAGIGQGSVAATPTQMACVAATIARDGLKMRPNLVAEGWTRPVTTRPSVPDRVELPVSKAALAAAREGMFRVVNAKGGTGPQLRRSEILVAGKTGSAQAAQMLVDHRDADGKLVREALEVPGKDGLNPEVPWYHALTHAWFIGFAPYDPQGIQKPKIAFAVLVEYGGGGGQMAGPIAQTVISAAEEEGYLAKTIQTADRR